MMNISFNPHSWRPSECCPFANLFADDLRILGVTFNKKLSWSTHIANISRLANTRLHALRLLRTTLNPVELRALYCATVRSILEYASPVFINLSASLHKKLTRIQKRAHKIICGDYKCRCLEDLAARRDCAAARLFKKVQQENNVLHPFLPPRSARTGRFILPYCRTKRKLDTFFMSCCI